jgi:hypothetical protein
VDFERIQHAFAGDDDLKIRGHIYSNLRES